MFSYIIIEINPYLLLNEIVCFYSDGTKFKKLIEPIMLKKESNGNLDHVELIMTPEKVTNNLSKIINEKGESSCLNQMKKVQNG